MTPPKRWNPGDAILAERLNSLISESVISRREVSLGNGSSLVNETLGNQSANMRKPLIKLVVATEDFSLRDYPTDLNGVVDDVPSGFVRHVRLNRRTGNHARDTSSQLFMAWDVVGGLVGNSAEQSTSDSSVSTECSLTTDTSEVIDSTSNSTSDAASRLLSTKRQCDLFYVIYNEDSKRWEVLAGGVSTPANYIHGIVGTHLGCGYYEIEIAEWNGTTPSTSESDSITADNCTPCGDEASASASDLGCPDIMLPEPPLEVEGTGVIVLAFHAGSVWVPLLVGSQCLMIDTGAENAAISTSTDSPSDSSGNNEAVYQIITGLHQHVVQYVERWECCDGVDTLVGKTPIIFPGIECAELICTECV